MPLLLFPVLGGASYVDDFDYEKPDGRHHQGNDLMAPEGTPLLAVDEGEARFGGPDPLGGWVVNLYAPDGTRYYYAHLSAFEGGGPGTRRKVEPGDVLGYVGTTGNAQGGPAHVHFEIHPGGGPAVDPYRTLRDAPVVTSSMLSRAKSALPLFAFLALAGVGMWFAVGRPVPVTVRRLLRT